MDGYIILRQGYYGKEKEFKLDDYVNYEEFLEATQKFNSQNQDLILVDSEECLQPSGSACPDFSKIELLYINDSNSYPIDYDVLEAFDELFSIESLGSDLDAVLETIQDAYLGKYSSHADYAEEQMKDCYTIPEHLANYIDYEKYARDLELDYAFREYNNHFFNPEYN